MASICLKALYRRLPQQGEEVPEFCPRIRHNVRKITHVL